MKLYIYRYDAEWGDGLALVVADDRDESDEFIQQALKNDELYGDWLYEMEMEVIGQEKGLKISGQHEG